MKMIKAQDGSIVNLDKVTIIKTFGRTNCKKMIEAFVPEMNGWWLIAENEGESKEECDEMALLVQDEIERWLASDEALLAIPQNTDLVKSLERRENQNDN